MEGCGEGWDGDLKHLSMRAWRDESDLAAMVVTRGGEAAGWINLKHVGPRETRWVWLWIRYAARFRPPADVLHADELADLLSGGEPRAREA